MNIIILSGPICSGKSTVSKIFKKYGYRILSSDIIAKNIIRKNKILQKKISVLFKDMTIFQNRVNWRKLREYAFLDKKSILKYNKLVHPYFFKELNQIILNSKKDTIIELPLIEKLSNINHKIFVISVISNKQIRLERLKKRNIGDKTIYNIVSSQKNNSFYVKKSDFTIRNNGTITKLKKSVNTLRDLLNE